MQKYVGKVNGKTGDPKDNRHGDFKDSFDDLRQQLPSNVKARNSKPLGVNVQRSKQAVLVKTEDDAHHDQAAAKRLSGDQAAFYDTGASSIGLTSTAASVNGDDANAADNIPGEEYSSGVDDEEHVEGESDEAEPWDYAPQPDETDSRARARALEHHLQTGASHGVGLPYMTGDSYPSTTSGNPSVVEAPSGAATQRVDPQRGIQTTVQNLPNRQSGQRRSLAHTTGINSHAQSPGYPKHAVPSYSTFNGFPNGSTQDPMPHAASGFAYSKPPQQQKPAVTSTGNGQAKAVSRGSASTASTNSVQPTTAHTNDGRSHNLFPGKQQQSGGRRLIGDYTPPLTSQPIRPPEQPVTVVPTAERRRDQSEGTDHVQSGGHSIHHREPERELDYDAQKLSGMDYHALKKEPFDINPNAQALDHEQQRESITERIAALQEMPAKAQAGLFEKLSMKEWEQGGDWFLDQFSAVLNQLKGVRQQRRKAAQEYEDDIEGRFKAVGQKRKQIDMALGEMKESGGKVLQGPPKKSKTK